MKKLENRLASLFALAFLFMGATSPAEPSLFSDSSESPYQTPTLGIELTEPVLKRLYDAHNRYYMANQAFSAAQVALVILGSVEAFTPESWMSSDTRFTGAVISLVPFLVATLPRPFLTIATESIRGRLSAGESEDPEILKKRDAFLAVPGGTVFERPSSDPSKAGICSRVARASFHPAEIAVHAAGAGLLVWSVASFQKEITQAWMDIRKELKRYAK